MKLLSCLIAKAMHGLTWRRGPWCCSHRVASLVMRRFAFSAKDGLAAEVQITLQTHVHMATAWDSYWTCCDSFNLGFDVVLPLTRSAV